MRVVWDEEVGWMRRRHQSTQPIVPMDGAHPPPTYRDGRPKLRFIGHAARAISTGSAGGSRQRGRRPQKLVPRRLTGADGVEEAGVRL